MCELLFSPPTYSIKTGSNNTRFLPAGHYMASGPLGPRRAWALDHRPEANTHSKTKVHTSVKRVRMLPIHAVQQAHAENPAPRRPSSVVVRLVRLVLRLVDLEPKMPASTRTLTTCAAGNALGGRPRAGPGAVQRLSAPGEHLDGQLGQLSWAPAA